VPQGTFGRHRDLSAGKRDDKREQAREAKAYRESGGPSAPLRHPGRQERAGLRTHSVATATSVQASCATALRLNLRRSGCLTVLKTERIRHDKQELRESEDAGLKARRYT